MLFSFEDCFRVALFFRTVTVTCVYRYKLHIQRDFLPLAFYCTEEDGGKRGMMQAGGWSLVSLSSLGTGFSKRSGRSTSLCRFLSSFLSGSGVCVCCEEL